MICLVYNIKRSENILGIEKLMEKLKNWKPDYKKATHVYSKTIQLWINRGEENFQLTIAA